MAKKLNFGNVLSKFGRPKLFRKFWFCLMIDIITNYHRMQFHRKILVQTHENDQKTKKTKTKKNTRLFSVWFRPERPKFDHQIFFWKIRICQSLGIMVSYHRVKYLKKLMIQSWENLMTDRQTDRWELFHRTLSN